MGFPCGQSTAQPATAAVRLDRQAARKSGSAARQKRATRNPQLHIVPNECVLNQPLNSGANAVQKMEAF